MEGDFVGAGWAFPPRVNGSGGIALVRYERELEEAMRIILLTYPGERPMRPDFGSGLLALVFEPNSTTLAATTQMLVQGALQEHLSHLIAVQAVDVRNDDGALRVDVSYTVLLDRTTHSLSLTAPGSGT